MEKFKIQPGVYRLADAVFTQISCAYCDLKFGSFSMDVIDCAEAAYENGWRINKADKVKCPKCVKKMKRS